MQNIQELDSASNSSATSRNSNTLLSSSSVQHNEINPLKNLGKAIEELLTVNRSLSQELVIPTEYVPSEQLELSRTFIDQMAYILVTNAVLKPDKKTCQSSHPTSNVTAVAIEVLPDNSIIWLAANFGISEATEQFANELICQLRQHAVLISECDVVAAQSTLLGDGSSLFEKMAELERLLPGFNNLLGSVVFFKRGQVQSAVSLFKEHLKKLLTIIREGSVLPRNYVRTKKIEGWLRKREDDIKQLDICELAIRMFSLREDPTFVALCDYPHLKTDEITCKQFSGALYDLGRPVFAVLVLLKAVKNLGFFKQVVSVETSNGTQQYSHHAKTSQNLRIHAEIQLVELFCRSNRRFLLDDDYVGCSKPACFCCYTYITKVVNPHRNRKFTIRHAHMKAYSWNFPTINIGQAVHGTRVSSRSEIEAAIEEMITQCQSAHEEAQKMRERGQNQIIYSDGVRGMPTLSYWKLQAANQGQGPN